ncbi:tyrosine-type recombinase/integrase [Porticoccaceae bacterium]|nr:tyrosine-type recombinase/integrase [Porticoccaceae bacterium]
MLTDAKVRNAKPKSSSYKLTDDRGLHIKVYPNNSKLWQLRYRLDGKQKTASLGKYSEVSLAEVRKKRDAIRKSLGQGIDPIEEKREAKRQKLLAAEHTFEAIARDWLLWWGPSRSERHVGYVARRLENDVFPIIGKKLLPEIEAQDVVFMTKLIEKRGALDLAKRAYQTTGQIFRYAVAHGLIKRNPTADVKPADILASSKPTNYARLSARELPRLQQKIEAYQGSAITRLATKFMMMNFVRTKELIGATWAEIDMDKAEWRIPAERMKMKSPHIVPLSRQSVQLLKSLQIITGHRKHLFPGERDPQKTISNNTILKALERMGYKGRMTGHGFRGLASTVLHEEGFNHQHIELQLAHQERNKVSASYNHATYLEKRRHMMQWWSDYLDEQLANG